MRSTSIKIDLFMIGMLLTGQSCTAAPPTDVLHILEPVTPAPSATPFVQPPTELPATPTDVPAQPVQHTTVPVSLAAEGVAHDANLPLGIMLETPSAAVTADLLAREVDFFSIGTNDLIQYALAVDRSNKDVAGLYTAADPSVLRLIDMAVSIAQKYEVPISMCGQMCGNPLYTMLLLGMGLRSMSVTPAAIPEIKQVCRRVDIPNCERVAKRALELESAPHVKTYLKEELTKFLPELPV